MAKISQLELEGNIVYWASGEGGTSYKEMCDLYDADETMKMQIDRTFQKLRKANKIKKARNGKQMLWYAMPRPFQPVSAPEATAANGG